MSRFLLALIFACGFARTSSVAADEPLVPLIELGTAAYQGKQGGLWPEGANTPPAAQIEALWKATARIVPRDAQGRPSADGRICLVSVGASTGKQMMDGMIARAENTSGLNPRVTLVNGCVGGADVNKLLDEKYWSKMDDSLASADLTAAQVQAAWLQTDDLRDKRPTSPADRNVTRKNSSASCNSSNKSSRTCRCFICSIVTRPPSARATRQRGSTANRDPTTSAGRTSG